MRVSVVKYQFKQFALQFEEVLICLEVFSLNLMTRANRFFDRLQKKFSNESFIQSANLNIMTKAKDVKTVTSNQLKIAKFHLFYTLTLRGMCEGILLSHPFFCLSA